MSSNAATKQAAQRQGSAGFDQERRQATRAPNKLDSGAMFAFCLPQNTESTMKQKSLATAACQRTGCRRTHTHRSTETEALGDSAGHGAAF